MSKPNGDKKVVEISKSLIEDSNDRDNVSSNCCHNCYILYSFLGTV